MLQQQPAWKRQQQRQGWRASILVLRDNISPACERPLEVTTSVCHTSTAGSTDACVPEIQYKLKSKKQLKLCLLQKNQKSSQLSCC